MLSQYRSFHLIITAVKGLHSYCRFSPFKVRHIYRSHIHIDRHTSRRLLPRRVSNLGHVDSWSTGFEPPTLQSPDDPPSQLSHTHPDSYIHSDSYISAATTSLPLSGVVRSVTSICSKAFRVRVTVLDWTVFQWKKIEKRGDQPSYPEPRVL